MCEIPNNCNQETFEYFMKSFTYTDADDKRQLTDAELKELCLRNKCVVRMSRWNPCHDIVRGLRRKQRLVNKTPKQCYKLIAKYLNRYKEKLQYLEEAKRTIQIEEWRHRKKTSLLLIDLWEYDRKNPTIASQTFCESQLSPLSQQNQLSQQHPLSQPDLLSQQNPLSQQDPLSQCNNDINKFFKQLHNVNTESMIVNTEDSCSSVIVLTEEVPYTNSSNYEEFNRSVPCTSTQD